MERLTTRDSDGRVYPAKLTQHIGEDMDNKLADYEDLGMDPHDLFLMLNDYGRMSDKVQEYEDAEEQGRLFILPVAKDSKVYYVPDYLFGRDRLIDELTVMGYRIFEDGATYLRVKQTRFSGTLVNIKRIGDDVFLTREEAEAKLKELEAST